MAVFTPSQHVEGRHERAFESIRSLRRSLSMLNQLNLSRQDTTLLGLRRPRSQDQLPREPLKFIVNVDVTRSSLLKNEDTDQNDQITVDDDGPKTIALGTVPSLGHRRLKVRGTYTLANLLQSLTVAFENDVKCIVLRGDALTENPVDRLSRLIKDTFWPSLTRRLDENMIEKAALDEKDWTENPQPRIYVPMEEPEQFEYYMEIARRRPELRLDVRLVPKQVTFEVYREMNKRPGLLALAVDPCPGNDDTADIGPGPYPPVPRLRGVPFIVPGGRFNELYGWDSFFTALGLLSDGYIELAEGIVRNFVFEIQHYGLIPNANRSYFLLRSQPPFLTNLALRVYELTLLKKGSKELLRGAILAAIKEYNQVWMSEPRYDARTGLSRYRPKGFGIPLECESGHFDHILDPYAKRHGLSIVDFQKAYNNGWISEPDLDIYFLHDRAVRESGHDVSVRLEFLCADVATVDLNCCLYKYEMDIARTIRSVFQDRLVVPAEFSLFGEVPNRVETSASWLRKARKRKLRMDRFLWNPNKGMYFDYDTLQNRQLSYETVSCFWTMWCGVASPEQAHALVSNALPKFECRGGLSVGTEDFRGRRTCHKAHQWDYPYGWAPHQVLAWDGLRNYGYHQEAERLAYRWLHLITSVYVNYGAVVEKYDVTNLIDGHKVDAEYGNQGLDFSGFAREGFGWTNGSYVYGLQMMSSYQKRALGVCCPYELYARAEETLRERDLDEMLSYADQASAGTEKGPDLSAASFENSTGRHSHNDCSNHAAGMSDPRISHTAMKYNDQNGNGYGHIVRHDSAMTSGSIDDDKITMN